MPLSLIDTTLDFADGGSPLLNKLSKKMGANNAFVSEFRFGQPFGVYMAQGSTDIAWAYADKWMASDPVAKFTKHTRFKIAAVDDGVEWKTIEKSEAYQQVYRPLQMGRFLVLPLKGSRFSSPYFSHIVFTRSRQQAAFDADDRARLWAQRDALVGLAGRSERSADWRNLEAVAEGVLAHAGDQAALVIDHRGRTVWCSHRAQHWIDDDSRQLLQDAARAQLQTVPMVLPIGSDETLHAVATLRAFTTFANRHYTLVSIAPTDRTAMLFDRARLLGLSPAQARVMACLNPEAIAKNVFLSIHTVHTHMRDCYERLGVHSRAEAIRLLLSA